jgi:hypothetical protein
MTNPFVATTSATCTTGLKETKWSARGAKRDDAPDRSAEHAETAERHAQSRSDDVALGDDWIEGDEVERAEGCAACQRARQSTDENAPVSPGHVPSPMPTQDL